MVCIPATSLNMASWLHRSSNFNTAIFFGFVPVRTALLELDTVSHVDCHGELAVVDAFAVPAGSNVSVPDCTVLLDLHWCLLFMFDKRSSGNVSLGPSCCRE